MANIQAPPYLANNSVRNDSEMLIRRSLDRFLLLMMRFPLNIVTEAKNQAALSKHAKGAGCPRQTDRILHTYRQSVFENLSALMNICQDNRINIRITITVNMGSSINLEHRLEAST